MVYYLTCTLPENEVFTNNLSPAAITKSKYIEKCLNEQKIHHKHIYLGVRSKMGVYLENESQVNDYQTDISIFSFGGNIGEDVFGRITRKICYGRIRSSLEKFLDRLTEKDVVILYHVLLASDIIVRKKKEKNFKLILELEEIYQEVSDLKEIFCRRERDIIKIADGYLLSTEGLKTSIEASKNFVVVNGIYTSEKQREPEPFDDNKVHCVYAGTLAQTKGATAAVAAAEFLPENYHVHILGFGTENEKKQLIRKISEVQKKARCTVTFDGLKVGEEYIRFLQKCHIGLCTQIPDAKYVETSFPSKILVYLANGLRVLSVRIPAVEQSSVGDMLYYYDEQKPECIAKAITSIDTSKMYNSREMLRALDVKFQRELRELVEAVNCEDN